MSYLYFDESLRDNGGFILGALIVSDTDLTPAVHDLWRSMGLDPNVFEYKSSRLKIREVAGQQQREEIRGLLRESRLALAVCPRNEQTRLGSYCVALVQQLLDTDMLPSGPHTLFLDQNISVSHNERVGLRKHSVSVFSDQDSRIVAGLQVADDAAHTLSMMLLEDMKIVTKMVRAGENSGYDPDLEIELGFELWASLRRSIIGKYDDEASHALVEGLFTPLCRVEGYGLYLAPSCDAILTAHARARFGMNYLGCIH